VRAATPLRLAHRGDWRRAPENTIEAIRAALAIPACDGVEFDVQLAGDGVPILLHDDTLDRVQGRPERPGELSSADLAALGVPTLADVLGAVPPDAFLDIELKDDTGPAAVEVIEAHRGPVLRAAVVSSFEPAALERVGSMRPDWRRWLNAEDLGAEAIRLALELGCAGIAAEHRSITPATMRRATSAGLEVAGWTVTRRPTVGRLADLGVVAVCVEGPALDG
jgi:glycerophosphoryl diester phosphodiesterase